MQVAQFFLTGIRLFLPCWSLDGEKQPRREATISPRVNCNYYYFFSDRKISRRLLKLFICRHLFALFIPTPPPTVASWRAQHRKKTRVLKKMPVSMQPIIFANHSDTRFCMPSPESFCYSFHMIDNDHDSHYWNDYSLFRFGRSYKRWWFIVVFSMTWIRRNAKNWRPVGLEWIWSPF